MGVESGGTASIGAPADPFEQPWGQRERGRHALDQRAGSIRVEQLLRSHAGVAPARVLNGTGLTEKLAAARAEIDVLTIALLDAQESVTVARQDAAAQNAELRAELDDRQTGWDVRVRELEKELDELSGELAAQVESASASPDADRVDDEQRLRAEATAARAEATDARAEAEDAWAEADAAFVELADAFAALSAAEMRIAELEASMTVRRRRAR